MNEEKHSLKITSKIWSSERYVAAFTYAPVPLTNTNVSINPRGLNCGMRVHLHPYFVNARSEGSGESAYIRKLA